ncbi:MAG TPA: polyphenol oxidase family protein [Acidimicrobiia bacterium]|nr:polyphenol oxidase family protein [Acidimicrobiia bacterium]
MIQPRAGVAFSLAAAGDLRNDRAARAQFSAELGIPTAWATVRQVHGSHVVEASGAGDLGEADALFTLRPMLPVAVFTADCAGVVLGADNGVGIAHAGWRGAVGGVVSKLIAAMTDAGAVPRWAAIGPFISPCCFEVGPDVAGLFGDHVATTSWGTVSVDLGRSLQGQLEGLEAWQSGLCTFHDGSSFSHRRDATPARMAAVAWLPA